MNRVAGKMVKSASADNMQKELDELKGTNVHLRDLVQALQTNSIRLQGILYKYRPFSLGLLSSDWEQRYFTLYGSTLKYHKSSKDIMLHPRGQVDVSGCVVEVEGLKGRYWTFGVISRAGHSLLRLSSDDEATANRWVEALEAAGCKRRVVRTLARHRSPLPGADIRWNPYAVPKNDRGLPNPAVTNKLHDRWEESDSDSDAYQLPPRPRRVVSNLRPPPTPAPAPPSTSSIASASPRSCSPPIDSDASSSDRADSPAPRTTHPSTPRAPPAGGRPPMAGSTPVHSGNKYSLLSSERISLHQHSGLLNLVMVILLATNFRLILENLLKYGLRFNPVRYVKRALTGKGNLGVVLAFPGLLLCAAAALALERHASRLLTAELQAREGVEKKEAGDRRKLLQSLQRQASAAERLVLTGHLLVSTTALIAPCVVISYTKPEVMPGMALVMCAIVVWMKLVSYAHCCWDLRAARRNGQGVGPGERGSTSAGGGTESEWMLLRYPENLTLGNMLYFLAAPTLTYQVNFPRSSRLRKRWLLRRVAELMAYLGLLLFIVEQYIEPAVANSLQPLRTMDWVRLVERVLKLAVPNMYAWLCMFYCLFHLWLNILAEVLRFGDREFYKDWWNAPTLGDYWRLWNMPVHKWLLRTIYFPALHLGVSKVWAMVLVFFVSAVFHELVIGVPLHMVRFWAFAGIMLQVPLVMITDRINKRINNATVGNLVFWFTFCVVGQPVSLLMYYHDYLVDARPDLLPPPGPAAVFKPSGPEVFAAA